MRRATMGGSSEASEDTTCADTNPPDSPPLPRRKTFSHYTQVCGAPRVGNPSFGVFRFMMQPGRGAKRQQLIAA